MNVPAAEIHPHSPIRTHIHTRVIRLRVKEWGGFNDLGTPFARGGICPGLTELSAVDLGV